MKRKILALEAAAKFEENESKIMAKLAQLENKMEKQTEEMNEKLNKQSEDLKKQLDDLKLSQAQDLNSQVITIGKKVEDVCRNN